MPTRTGYGIGAPELTALAPFHLIWDADLTVLQSGDVIARLMPGLLTGCRLTQEFTIVRPRGVRSYADLAEAGSPQCRAGGRLTLLRSIADERLALKGQLVTLDDGERMLFFGAPVAVDLQALAALGLTLQDFAVHDGIADFLLVLRSQATSLAQAQELADRLHTLNAELEDRVQAEVAQRHRVEEDLRLAHKLEAVGQLAAGIAHEINTPVQFVGSNLGFLGEALQRAEQVLRVYADLARAIEREPVTAEVRAALDQVRAEVHEADLEYLLAEGARAVSESLEGTDRVSAIVRAMKEFAHPDRQDLTPTDLNRCVGTTLVVCRNEYRDVADVVTELDPDLPAVPCLPGEINQVLLNLFVNAAQAIASRPDGGRGTIRVVTERSGDQVRIRVQDDGGGIPVDIRPRIFDPFFTTKDVGRGTGQGLSTSRSIITARHGGTLTFSCRAGGTEFVISLPLDPPSARAGA